MPVQHLWEVFSHADITLETIHAQVSTAVTYISPKVIIRNPHE